MRLEGRYPGLAENKVKKSKARHDGSHVCVSTNPFTIMLSATTTLSSFINYSVAMHPSVFLFYMYYSIYAMVSFA
jgi:hypothetical protein